MSPPNVRALVESGILRDVILICDASQMKQRGPVEGGSVKIGAAADFSRPVWRTPPGRAKDSAIFQDEERFPLG
jgi:hypothetical protein